MKLNKNSLYHEILVKANGQPQAEKMVRQQAENPYIIDRKTEQTINNYFKENVASKLHGNLI